MSSCEESKRYKEIAGRVEKEIMTKEEVIKGMKVEMAKLIVIASEEDVKREEARERMLQSVEEQTTEKENWKKEMIVLQEKHDGVILEKTRELTMELTTMDIKMREEREQHQEEREELERSYQQKMTERKRKVDKEKETMVLVLKERQATLEKELKEQLIVNQKLPIIQRKFRDIVQARILRGHEERACETEKVVKERLKVVMRREQACEVREIRLQETSFDWRKRVHEYEVIERELSERCVEMDLKEKTASEEREKMLMREGKVMEREKNVAVAEQER